MTEKWVHLFIKLAPYGSVCAYWLSGKTGVAPSRLVIMTWWSHGNETEATWPVLLSMVGRLQARGDLIKPLSHMEGSLPVMRLGTGVHAQQPIGAFLFDDPRGVVQGIVVALRSGRRWGVIEIRDISLTGSVLSAAEFQKLMRNALGVLNSPEPAAQPVQRR